MFPITEKYIEREYTIAGNHLMVTSEHVARTIEQKAKKVLKMLRGKVYSDSARRIVYLGKTKNK